MKTIMFAVSTLLVLSSYYSAPLAQDTTKAKTDSAGVNRLDSVETQLRLLKASLDSFIDHSASQDSVITRSPYTVSIGASFDFIEGLKSSDLYAELNVSLLDLWGGVDQPWKSIGLLGGVNQGRSYFEEENYTYQETYSVDTNPADTVLTIVNRTVNQRIQREAVNLSLYFSPTLRTLKYLYIATHFEVRRIDLITLVSEDVLRSDTSQSVTEPDTSQPVGFFHDVSPSWSTTTTFGEVYLGVGPLLYYTDNQVDFFFKTSFGVGFYSRYWTSTHDLFALFQFKVIEKSLGVRFGGEIRVHQSNLPDSGGLELQMYLTKDFSLNKLRELLERD